jgi:YVTN family beta-propeller protein
MPRVPRSRTTAGRVCSIVLGIAWGLGTSAPASAQETAALTFEASVPLGAIRGRIDHLTIDLARRRLYVAELGNDSVGVVDLDTRKVLHTLTGFAEPQGIAYVAATDEVYVANGGDGSVHILKGADGSTAGRVELGDDADNVRVDRSRRFVAVGHGSGGLALIDPVSHRKVVDIPLGGHPESFQLSGDGARAYVNVPGAREVAVLDVANRKPLRSWPTGNLSANFPLVMGEGEQSVWVVFRSPARLASFDTATGKATVTLDTCSDSDDVFVDSARHRLYVICGGGRVESWDVRDPAKPARISSSTLPDGARTGLFVPELDRLYVAVRAASGVPAAVWIFKPSPLPN